MILQAIVGSAPELGAWDASKAVRMEWAPGHSWSAEVLLPASLKDVEYKVGCDVRCELGAVGLCERGMLGDCRSLICRKEVSQR